MELKEESKKQVRELVYSIEKFRLEIKSNYEDTSQDPKIHVLNKSDLAIMNFLIILFGSAKAILD